VEEKSGTDADKKHREHLWAVVDDKATWQTNASSRIWCTLAAS
jgi:hypothetical protein